MSIPGTRLGNTGLQVSRLALGTMTFGYQTDEQTSRQILDKATDAGINLLDTADVYPLGGGLERVGATEEILGRWLKGRRQHFILATKANGKVGPNAWDQGNSRKHLLDALDASLRRLQTDYIDLYQLHADDPDTPLEETLEALHSLVQSGKVRYIGVSNFLAYRLARALGKQQAASLVRFTAVQPRYNLLFREIERELLPLAQEEGLGVLPYNPLAGGLLTGKHQPGTPPQGRFTLGTAAQRYQERYWHEREFAAVEQLKALAREAGASLTTLSVAWVLANPVITSVLLGASRPEQLDLTLAGGDYLLGPDIKHRLDEISAEFRRGDATR